MFPAEAEAVSVPAPAPLPVPVHPAPRIVPHATPAAVTAADPDASVRWRGSLSAAEPPSSAHGSGGFSLRVLAAVLLAGIAIGLVGGYLLANSRRMNARVPATADARIWR